MSLPRTSRRRFLLGPWRRSRGAAEGGTARTPPGGGPQRAGVRAPTPDATPPSVALLDPRHCLHAVQQVCSVCVERCRVPGAMRLEDGGPVVDPRACTGCGECVDACPAPVTALRLVPFGRRRP